MMMLAMLWGRDPNINFVKYIYAMGWQDALEATLSIKRYTVMNSLPVLIPPPIAYYLIRSKI